MQEESLKNKTVKGVGWSAADAFLGQGVTFVVGLVLARLLSPAEYGLIGICLIFTTVLGGIVDSGFSNALIRKKDVTNEDYNTMFITNMVLSIVLYVFLFIGSPFISSFFNRSELTSLVRVMGGMLVFQALSITQVTVLTKKLDFKTKTKASLISSIFSGAIGITIAYLGFGVWSLVWQKLSQILLYTITLWILNKWYPNFTFSRTSFNYMWGFGSKMMLSGLLNNIWNQLYQIIVGKYYSPATLGQYTRSRQYAGIFSENFTAIVQRVSYPILAEIQEDEERMVVAYRKMIKTTMFISCVALLWVGAMSEPLIYCLIGPKWHEAATYLPLICISMSLYPLHAINLNMLQIQGRSDIFLYLEIIKKIINILPIALGIFVSVYWMLIGTIFAGILAFFLNSYYTGKKLGYSSWNQLTDIIPDYVVAILVALGVYFLKFLPIIYWYILLLQILVGLVICITISEIIQLPEYLEVKAILVNKILKIRRK
jgi:O-antigen/teichoic acid export membrane protein